MKLTVQKPADDGLDELDVDASGEIVTKIRQLTVTDVEAVVVEVEGRTVRLRLDGHEHPFLVVLAEHVDVRYPGRW